MVALVFFLVGAVIASGSNSFAPLLVGRSLQGIGGGGLVALTEIVVTDLIPLRLRGQWFGFISAMWSIGSVTGPIVGGAFSQNITWVSRSRHRSLKRKLIAQNRDGSSISTFPSLGSHSYLLPYS